MMLPQLSEHDREAFLAEPHIGVLSVASDGDRPPLAVPIWYGYEPGGTISFFTGTQGRRARKTRLIENAGVASLTVQKDSFPYKYVTVEGTIISIDRPPSPDQMLAIVRRYLPGAQAKGMVDSELNDPSENLVLFTMRPDRWLTADFSGAG